MNRFVLKMRFFLQIGRFNSKSDSFENEMLPQMDLAMSLRFCEIKLSFILKKTRSISLTGRGQR